MRYNIAILSIILFCASVSTSNYMLNYVEICDGCQIVVQDRADRILTGRISFPFVYRILTPNILKLLGGSVLSVAIFHFAGRALLLGLLYLWVEHWKGNGLASIGLMTVLLSIMSVTWYESDYALTEAVLLLMGWLLLVSKRLTTVHHLAFAILLLLGTMNREVTGGLLLISWLVIHYRSRWTIPYVVIVVGVFIGLRLSIGFVSQSYGMADILERNLTQWRLLGAIIYNSILLPLWVGLVLYCRDMPQQYRRLLLILIPYTVMFLVFGIWQEIRLLMPFALMLFPLISENYPQHIKE